MEKATIMGISSASQSAQGSSVWRAARCGLVTASRIGELIARTKSGWSTSRGNYMGQLLAERLSGQPTPSASTPAMRWGLECEPLAKASYGFYTDLDVEDVGLIHHPQISMSGASPDGLVGTEGLVEIKCPTTVTHVETLASGVVSEKHLPQIQWQMACTGRFWCDFVSFDPRLPEDLKLFIQRVERANIYIAELEEMVIVFLEELEQRLATLTSEPRRQEAA